MDDTVYVFILHQLVEGFEVADVHLDKLVVRLALDVFQIGQVSGIGQLIQIDDVVFRVFVYKQTDYMTTDESCSTGDNDISFCHIIFRF